MTDLLKLILGIFTDRLLFVLPLSETQSGYAMPPLMVMTSNRELPAVN
jgi:hypothetical protein